MTHDLDDLRRRQAESEAHQPDCPCGICRPLHLRLKAELEENERILREAAAAGRYTPAPRHPL